MAHCQFRVCTLASPDMSSKTANMQGEAQREVVRVTVECCLQERAWNGYYAQLLGSLVRTVKGHRITLQFCLWDLIKGVCRFSMESCSAPWPCIVYLKG